LKGNPGEYNSSSIIVPRVSVVPPQNEKNRVSFVSNCSNSGTLISIKEEDKNFFHTE